MTMFDDLYSWQVTLGVLLVPQKIYIPSVATWQDGRPWERGLELDELAAPSADYKAGIPYHTVRHQEDRHNWAACCVRS